MATTKTDAHQLVADIIARKAGAEELLVREYGRGIRFILRRQSRDQGIVDDLYQETFRIAIERIRDDGLRDHAKLGSFLASTARFVVIDHFRREARHENMADVEDTDIPVGGNSQLHGLIDQEHAQLVRAAINEMKNERDRAILFRFYIAQEEKSTICADLDLTALHFNRVLHRAKQRYKELYLEMKARQEP